MQVSALAKATGVMAVTNIDDLSQADPGYADLVEEKRVELDGWVLLEVWMRSCIFLYSYRARYSQVKGINCDNQWRPIRRKSCSQCITVQTSSYYLAIMSFQHMETRKRSEVHEYLHPLGPVYKECVYCGERKSMVCLICGYCYECHPAIEQIERRLLVRVSAII